MHKQYNRTLLYHCPEEQCDAAYASLKDISKHMVNFHEMTSEAIQALVVEWYSEISEEEIARSQLESLQRSAAAGIRNGKRFRAPFQDPRERRKRCR